MDAAALIMAIDTRMARVRTSSLDISFNELLDMYTTGELVIQPDYQRLFRWSFLKRSQFIESIALEMPIPPVYVIEVEEGQYELIDGLQRISTYLHFRGQHPDYKDQDSEHPRLLTLVHCDIVPELNGFTFDTLPAALQIKLRRPFVRVEVIRKGSDVRYRYHMFKRLNTGGEDLSDQEVRNCTIRLLDPTFNDFLVECAKNADFRICMERTRDSDKQRMYLEECVLRFFALKNNRRAYDHLVGEFLTDYLESVSDPVNPAPFDYAREREVFEKTFRVLRVAMGDQVFATYNPNGKFLMNNFSANHFEAISLGTAQVVDNLDPEDAGKMQELSVRLVDLKGNPDFLSQTRGGGLNYSGPLNARIDLAASVLREIAGA